ncbi:hypothetical protein KUD11_08685 [Roseovarius sp. LXJ103]|uniref:hypothetical protein n=1 Tax=Roseovarius carneus TaxID=2853164 RepID=UPI0011B28C5F|nr:hypothetical protein [Roseovarius carneus]MBZ8118724.1 hypothetical protein [Roseovarius carneus]
MTKKPKHSVNIYRASIRISLNGDTYSALRGLLKKNAFEPNGFINDPGAHGTGVWISNNCTVAEMRSCMRALWKTADQFKGPGKLDHVWSNFELIDLRSLLKSTQKADRMTPELFKFLQEVGIEVQE